eukprot:244138_1
MSSNEMFDYVIKKSGLSEEKALLLAHNGLDGAAIEIAINDGELNDVLRDAGFEWNEVGKLTKILCYDGWKTKQSYPITMDMEYFTEWVEKNVDANMVQNLVNNGIDGKTIGFMIEEGGDNLKEILIDCGINNEKQIELFRSKFVIDSNITILEYK